MQATNDTSLHLQHENKLLQQKILQLERELVVNTEAIRGKEKLLSDMSDSMSAATNFDDDFKSLSGQLQLDNNDGPNVHQVMKVADATIKTLKARLAQKEESSRKYQELLKSAKDDIQEIHQHYQRELLNLQEQLHAKKDTQFQHFRQLSEQDLNSQRSMDAIPTTEQFLRIRELEDMTSLHVSEMSDTKKQLAASHELTLEWKQKYDTHVKESERNNQRMTDEYLSEIQTLKEQVSALQKTLEEKETEVVLLQDDLEGMHDTNNQSPSARLAFQLRETKKKLEEQEKLNQKLSKALVSLKDELLTASETCAKCSGTLFSLNTGPFKPYKFDQSESGSEKGTGKKDKTAQLGIADVLRLELEKKEKQLVQLKQSKKALKEQVDELTSKVARMTTMQQQPGVVENIKQELKEQRKENDALKWRLKRLQQQHQNQLHSSSRF